MRHAFPRRLLAAGLSLLLLAAPGAQALTPGQCAELIQLFYVDEVPDSVLEQPTVEEMLDALGDPYTDYFSAEEYAAFNDYVDGDPIVGIGIVYRQTDDGLLLDEILLNSPAAQGGLEPGDVILAIDGKSVLDQSSETLNSWIQGEVGTPVRVTYLRGKDRFSVTLTRDVVRIPTTTSDLIDDHVGYISCTSFGNETLDYFRDALETYGNQADMWIVDLRHNLGGRTDAATDSAGLFTGPGDMAYLRDSDNWYSVYRTSEKSMTLYPVIVLVDDISASAAEIFASAVRDNGSGIVVGSRTYGKGVAQSVLDESNMPSVFDGDALKITSHRFFSPLGNTTDQVGVIPDLLVDDEYIGDVAYLLTTGSAVSTASDQLRLHMNWRWYIDLDFVAQEEYEDVLEVLLNAIPKDMEYVQLWRKASPDGDWGYTTPQDVAESLGLEYWPHDFPDVEDSELLNTLRTYDLIHGYDDGLFHPQETLTRAQFCQLLAGVLNLNMPQRLERYSDVDPAAWYAPAVVAVSDYGLVEGDGTGQFHPEAPIDHQQLLTILGRMGKRVNMRLFNTATNDTPTNLSELEELSGYADWAKPQVWLLWRGWRGYLLTVNLLWDEPENIAPTEPTTRYEAVQVLYNLLYRTQILPKNRNVITE